MNAKPPRRHIRITVDGKIVTATIDQMKIEFRPYRARKTTSLPLSDVFLLSKGQSLLAL